MSAIESVDEILCLNISMKFSPTSSNSTVLVVTDTKFNFEIFCNLF